MPGGLGHSDTKRKRLQTLESRLDASKRRGGGPSPGKQGQQPAGKKQKSSGQHAKQGARTPCPARHHGSGRPGQGPLPAAIEQITPPYDRLDGIGNAALHGNQQAEKYQDGAFVDSLLERLALENPKVASSRGALGLRQQDRNLLLDNPAGKLKKAHAANNSARQLLSGTKQKALGLQHPTLEQCKYEALWPLHLLWRQCVTGVFSASGASEEVAYQLDLHGSQMRVERHPNAQLVGLEGIAVKISNFNVHLVTKEDRRAVIPTTPGCELHYRVGNSDVVSLIR